MEGQSGKTILNPYAAASPGYFGKKQGGRPKIRVAALSGERGKFSGNFQASVGSNAFGRLAGTARENTAQKEARRNTLQRLGSISSILAK